MNIDKFASNFIGGGIRPHLFQVSGSIGGKSGVEETQMFHIKSASLPASTLGKIEVPYRGRKIPIPGDRTFEAWTIGVLCRGDLMLRDEFERWSNDINEHQANLSGGYGEKSAPPDHQPHGNKSAGKGFGANKNVFRDWNVTQLDRGGNALKEYTFYGCWPSSISAIEVKSDEADSVAEFTVELSYSYWTTEGLHFKHNSHKQAKG